jgi:hypothetical protein
MAIDTQKLELLRKDKSLGALKLLLEHFKESYQINPEELINLLEKPKEGTIPLSVFRTGSLSSLEIIVKYLKENLSMTYHQIAVLLNRNDRTIWSTYNNSLRKFSGPLANGRAEVFVPLSIFSSRASSVLESLVVYLKDSEGYSFAGIASCLLKDYQTIYTTYRRGKSR